MGAIKSQNFKVFQMIPTTEWKPNVIGEIASLADGFVVLMVYPDDHDQFFWEMQGGFRLSSEVKYPTLEQAKLAALGRALDLLVLCVKQASAATYQLQSEKHAPNQ